MKNSSDELLFFINNSIKIKKKIIKLHNKIDQAIDLIYSSLKEKRRVYICGNGGSAADAQHIAAEFMVRLRPEINRDPYPVISLALDTSTITACANDYSFENLFSRNLQGLGRKHDLLIAISTSGNSKNILRVLKTARKMNINSIALLGTGGGKAKEIADIDIIIPSNNTAQIQEEHIFLGHYIAYQVEKKLLKKNLGNSNI